VSRGLSALPALARETGIHFGDTITLAYVLGSEPTALALFGGGLTVIALILRRRIRQRNLAQSKRAKLELQTNS
jgi:hypothetical protein